LESVESRVMLSSVTGPIGHATRLSHSHATTPAVLAAKTAGKTKRLTGLVGAPSPAWTNTGNGLTGTYYRGTGFKNQVLTRTDPDINLLWGDGAPDPSLIGHAFSVRWTGQIMPQYSERYVFQTISDDGVRVWIGGKLIINDWQDQPATIVRGAISLQAGQSYDIRIDYYENGHPPAVLRLSWSSPSQPEEPVPASALTTTATQAPPPPITAVPMLPESPADLSASAVSQTQIHLSWDDVSGETGFIIEHSADGNTGWTTVGTSTARVTQFDDPGLSAGTAYFYRVDATSAVGNSTPSNIATATTIAAPPPAPHLVYGLTSDGYVEQVDTATAATTQIGTLLFGTSAGDRDPLTGKFYYLDQNTSTPRVAVWDPATNTNTVIGTATLSGPVLRAGFRADGTFFITAGNGDLYTINLVTGAPTFVGTITVNGSQLTTSTGDMAFTPDGRLYLDTEGLLYSVDTTTLDATYLGNDGAVGKIQIAFGTNGLLYGMANSGDLYLVDLTSGATTLIGDTGVSQIGDLAGGPLLF